MAIPEEERRLPAGEQRFITFMARHNDVAVAAEKAKITFAVAERAFKKPVVQAAITRKQSLVENEAARLTAKAIVVDVTLLDNELLRLVKLDPEKHPTAKRHALELGYRRTGMIREGEFVLPNQSTPQSGEGGGDGEKQPSAPSFYRAFESRTTTTVHEVREVHAPVHSEKAAIITAPPATVGRRRTSVPTIGMAD